jgi:hypothetical protein
MASNDARAYALEWEFAIWYASMYSSMSPAHRLTGFDRAPRSLRKGRRFRLAPRGRKADRPRRAASVRIPLDSAGHSATTRPPIPEHPAAI